MGETCWDPIYTYCAKKLDLSSFLSTFSFVLLTFLLILILFYGASDINLLVELNMAGKNQRIELVEEFISALREEVNNCHRPHSHYTGFILYHSLD